METFTDEMMRALLEESLDTAELGPSGWRDVGDTPGSTEGEFVDWLAIEDQERSIVHDVRRLREHPLVPPYIPIHGYLYDAATGRLREIAAARRNGERARRGARRAAPLASAKTARRRRP
jgi:carbonic anhydrase